MFRVTEALNQLVGELVSERGSGRIIAKSAQVIRDVASSQNQQLIVLNLLNIRTRCLK